MNNEIKLDPFFNDVIKGNQPGVPEKNPQRKKQIIPQPKPFPQPDKTPEVPKKPDKVPKKPELVPNREEYN